MEILVTLIALAAFGYFIYSKIRASKERDANRPAPQPRERTPRDDHYDLR